MKFLVVVDMQNDFINGSLGSEDAKSIVDDVVNKIKNFDGKVCYTLDTHTENYLKTQEGRILPVKHCIKGTLGWELNDKIKQAIEEKNGIKFEKIAFGSTDLATYMAKVSQNENIQSIELCGLCTDICVISNAFLLKSFLPETEILVDGSCCKGVTPESHENALEAMQACQIKVK